VELMERGEIVEEVELVDLVEWIIFGWDGSIAIINFEGKHLAIVNFKEK